MLFLSLYKRLPWCLKCCAFINLGEINAFTLSTILSRIKPIQQNGRLKLVTMEMHNSPIFSPTKIFPGGGRDYPKGLGSPWDYTVASSSWFAVKSIRFRICTVILISGANFRLKVPWSCGMVVVHFQILACFSKQNNGMPISM